MTKEGRIVFVFILCIIFLSFFVKADYIDDCYKIEYLNSTSTYVLVNTCNTNISITILGPSIIINPITPLEELITHSSATRYLANCVPNWQCSAFSACNGVFERRTCQDTNNCGFEYNKPVDRTSCSLVSNSLIQEGNSTLFIMIGVAFFLVLVIILLFVLRR